MLNTTLVKERIEDLQVKIESERKVIEGLEHLLGIYSVSHLMKINEQYFNNNQLIKINK